MKVAKAILGTAFALLLVTTFAVGAGADTNFNKRTVVTFNQPVEIPGQVLPSGTYTIELYESFGSRHIVRVYNADRSKIIATVLAIPNQRLKPTTETVMKFSERPGNAPDALKAWFYPDESTGQEFVYPKARAKELAHVNQEPVPAIETVPAPVEELKNQPIVAETPEQTETPVEVAEATPPPAPEPVPAPALPKTASDAPLIALLGMLSIASALILKRLARSGS